MVNNTNPDYSVIRGIGTYSIAPGSYNPKSVGYIGDATCGICSSSLNYHHHVNFVLSRTNISPTLDKNIWECIKCLHREAQGRLFV